MGVIVAEFRIEFVRCGECGGCGRSERRASREGRESRGVVKAVCLLAAGLRRSHRGGEKRIMLVNVLRGRLIVARS